LTWTNDFVKDSGYIAGTENMTVADIVFVATFSTILACEGLVDLTAYKELNSWFEKVKQGLPKYEEANGKGCEVFGGYYAKASTC